MHAGNVSSLALRTLSAAVLVACGISVYTLVKVSTMHQPTLTEDMPRRQRQFIMDTEPSLKEIVLYDPIIRHRRPQPPPRYEEDRVDMGVRMNSNQMQRLPRVAARDTRPLFQENDMGGSRFAERDTGSLFGERDTGSLFGERDTGSLFGERDSEPLIAATTARPRQKPRRTTRKTTPKPTRPPTSMEHVMPTEKRYPGCIIIGVRKGGTRPLLRFLNDNPRIVIVETETGFFNMRYKKGLDWYRNQMPAVTNDKFVIEKSADYFQSRDAPQRIHDMDPNMRLILIVREPIKRMISDYHFIRRYAERSPSKEFHFKEVNNTLEDLVYNKRTNKMKYDHGGLYRSRYSKFLQVWYEWFPKDQIMVIDGDLFAKQNPAPFLNKIETFLGLPRFARKEQFYLSVEKGFWCSKQYGCLQGEKGHRYPPLNKKVNDELQKYFQPYNKEFYDMTGTDFHWAQPTVKQ